MWNLVGGSKLLGCVFEEHIVPPLLPYSILLPGYHELNGFAAPCPPNLMDKNLKF
jgi:hypothetical protein